ncbi:MAG: hypothetical protein QOI26_2212, partial [Pseudonocardiales bacterium]|nr:hypothetical protein [Pseudonocardiales bacterium]
MPALTLILLGASLVIAPAPVLAQRRLGWLAATRWARPVQDRQGAALSRALTWRVLTGKPFGGAWVGLPAGLAAGVAAGPVPGVLAAATGWGLIRCARLLAAERESEQCRADLAATVAALHDEYAAGATVAAALTPAALSSGRFAPPVARA